MQDAEAKVSFVVKSIVQEWENSAGNLMYHFRIVFRAFPLFQKVRENMDTAKKLANLDDHAVCYFRTAMSLLDQRGMEILILLHRSYNVNADSIYNRLASRRIQNSG